MPGPINYRSAGAKPPAPMLVYPQPLAVLILKMP
jgi:hypothetical protein